MGRHTGALARRPSGDAQRRTAGSRSRAALFVFAFAASAAFVLVNVVDPYSGATASPYFKVAGRFDGEAVQALSVGAAAEVSVVRDGYDVTAKPAPPPVAAEPASASRSVPAAGTPDPGSAMAIALDLVHARGWDDGEYSCLVALWNRESHWNVYAHNSSSGAYGIPQALPGEKMASAGADWADNPATQITWGLGYISGRYGSPCGAWAHSEDVGWY